MVVPNILDCRLNRPRIEFCPTPKTPQFNTDFTLPWGSPISLRYLNPIRKLPPKSSSGHQKFEPTILRNTSTELAKRVNGHRIFSGRIGNAGYLFILYGVPFFLYIFSISFSWMAICCRDWIVFLLSMAFIEEAR